MNISDDYIPILLDTIRVDTTVGCDLYLQNCVDGKVKYILYCSGKNAIKLDKIEELLRHSVKKLFIRKEDQKIYLLYVESSLRSIINDDKVDIKEKTRVVYEVAKNIMVDVFEDPRSGDNIDRSINWVDNVVDLVLRDKGAFSTMAKIICFDYYTYTHSVNVALIGVSFAKYLGFEYEEIRAFGSGLLLHDIGKTQIDPKIINKTGSLTEEEFSKIKMHVQLGADVLTQLDKIDVVSLLPIVQHHEKYSGKGYPNGLRGDDIHVHGKVACIVDVYDALTTKRAYADARKPFTALQIMRDEMKGSFDDKLFKGFIVFLGSQGEKKH